MSRDKSLIELLRLNKAQEQEKWIKTHNNLLAFIKWFVITVASKRPIITTAWQISIFVSTASLLYLMDRKIQVKSFRGARLMK